MSDKNKDLMNPRYEVIADCPDSEFTVGDILEFTHMSRLPHVGLRKLSEEESKKEYWFTDWIDRGRKGTTMYCIVTFEPHPHLFHRLQWHEKRSIEEMPEYVLDNSALPKAVYKVSRWDYYFGEGSQDKSKCAFIEGRESPIIHLYALTPATESDYLTYQKQKDGK